MSRRAFSTAAYDYAASRFTSLSPRDRAAFLEMQTPENAAKTVREVWSHRPATSSENILLYGAPITKQTPFYLKQLPTTLFVLSSAAYIFATKDEPLSDSKLFDRRGDLQLPFITEALGMIITRLAETNRPVPGFDAYQDWNEDAVTARAKYLGENGAFNRYWKDQHDIVDYIRLMKATAERTLISRYTSALMFPEDNNATPDELFLKHNERASFQQLNKDAHGTCLKTAQELYGDYALALYSEHFGDNEQLDTQQEDVVAQYKKNTELLKSDFTAYEKLMNSQ